MLKEKMAFSINRALFFCIAAVGFVNGATHHHLAPAPSPTAVDCSALIMNMADCLTYVSSGSGVTKPEGNCCEGLKTVLRTRAECLCEGLKSSTQMGIVLNVTKAAMLPAACSLSAPSVSNCRLNAVTGPAAAPVGAPTGVLPDQIAPTQGNSGCNALISATFVSGIVFFGLIMCAV